MNRLSRKELQDRCLSRGLKTYGSKLILVERLNKYIDKTSSQIVAPVEAPVDQIVVL